MYHSWCQHTFTIILCSCAYNVTKCVLHSKNLHRSWSFPMHPICIVCYASWICFRVITGTDVCVFALTNRCNALRFNVCPFLVADPSSIVLCVPGTSGHGSLGTFLIPNLGKLAERKRQEVRGCACHYSSKINPSLLHSCAQLMCICGLSYRRLYHTHTVPLALAWMMTSRL